MSETRKKYVLHRRIWNGEDGVRQEIEEPFIIYDDEVAGMTEAEGEPGGTFVQLATELEHCGVIVRETMDEISEMMGFQVS